MNNPRESEDPLANASQEEVMSALFANMVLQQAQTAYMFLGKAPNPDTGQVMIDLETAKYFIDQLEMLAHKTKGNLDRQEAGLLNQSLTTLRLAFVEATGGKGATPPPPPLASDSGPSAPKAEAPKPAAQPAPAPQAAPVASPGPSTLSSEAERPEESRKKFSKRY
jgi:hypothetical protein